MMKRELEKLVELAMKVSLDLLGQMLSTYQHSQSHLMNQ